MKKIWIVFFMSISVGSISFAQAKAVHFKKLEEFLPNKELKNFQRLKPGGTSETIMGISTSEADVRYESIPIDTIPDHNGDTSKPATTIDIKISDMIGVPFASQAFQSQQNYENETEDSSQKSVTIKGRYKGIEEIYKGGTKVYKLDFAVADRYIINIELRGIDNLKIIYDLVNTMNLEKLERLTIETK
jgi:hypothetical protein